MPELRTQDEVADVKPFGAHRDGGGDGPRVEQVESPAAGRRKVIDEPRRVETDLFGGGRSHFDRGEVDADLWQVDAGESGRCRHDHSLLDEFGRQRLGVHDREHLDGAGERDVQRSDTAGVLLTDDRRRLHNHDGVELEAFNRSGRQQRDVLTQRRRGPPVGNSHIGTIERRGTAS